MKACGRRGFALGEREWPFWVVTGALPLALPPVSIVFYRRLLASGRLNPNSDTILIPIVDDAMAAMVIAPVVLAVTWICLRRYEGGASLFGWDRLRPWRSLAATLVLGVPAGAIAVAVAIDIVAREAWYEYLWDFYFGLWATWLLLLRAAVLAPGATPPCAMSVEQGGGITG